MSASDAEPRHRTLRPAVDWTACQGHGGCADLLPELVTLDEWGYPVIHEGPVPEEAQRRARKAVSECPALAFLLTGRSAIANINSGPVTLRGVGRSQST